MKIMHMTPGILLLFLVSFTGCYGIPVKFNTMPAQSYDATRGRTVEGSACGFQLLAFIPISINDRAWRAYSELVQEAGADYVTDIKVKEKWYYAALGTVYCTEMQATAYPKIVPAAVPAPQEKPQLAPAEECIRACKEGTNRTSEECLDACKR